MYIEAATKEDLPDVQSLLERQHLTPEGIEDHVGTMLVAREDSRIVGTAALELYGDAALLRSVAVDAGQQRRGLGQLLTQEALELAQRHGVRDVFLLTITAEQFFPRFGFETITREAVPTSVQTSVQFRSACPASSIVMKRRLVVA
jgi:amino-acid N-acetyltransferase